MKYTKEQLEAMSDFEVNESLCLKLGYKLMPDVAPIHDLQAAVYHNGCKHSEYNGTEINFCNNWNDIMPLAVEYGVNVNPNAGSAYAVLQPENQFRFCNNDSPNAQRAIACCLLLMELQP